jgi:hypothetical protein
LELDESALDSDLTPASSFPLVDDKIHLTQLMCLLRPVVALIRQSQAEEANQVSVLVLMYKLRLTVLNPRSVLFEDEAEVLRPCEQTNLITLTRQLLSDAFEKNFFSRYTNTDKFNKFSYSFELQMMLHPKYKNLDLTVSIIRFCNAARGVSDEDCSAIVDTVLGILRCKLIDHMMKFADPSNNHTIARASGNEFSAETATLFQLPRARQNQSFVRMIPREVTAELDEWLSCGLALGTQLDGTEYSVLDFWRQQQEGQRFKFLPSVAKVLFALPPSSAQIERDFGASGLILNSLRTRLVDHNVTMCSFIKSNRTFVDVLTCPRLEADKLADFVPTTAAIDVNSGEEESKDDDADADIDDFYQCFSNTNIA